MFQASLTQERSEAALTLSFKKSERETGVSLQLQIFFHFSNVFLHLLWLAEGYSVLCVLSNPRCTEEGSCVFLYLWLQYGCVNSVSD